MPSNAHIVCAKKKKKKIEKNNDFLSTDKAELFGFR